MTHPAPAPGACCSGHEVTPNIKTSASAECTKVLTISHQIMSVGSGFVTFCRSVELEDEINILPCMGSGICLQGRLKNIYFL